MARACKTCGAPIGWGIPQCERCGNRTVWWSGLTTFGIVVGAGTALVVAAVIARLWLMPPPPEVALQRALDDLLAGMHADPLLRAHVAGAGRCRQPPGAICVQMTAAFAALAPNDRARVAHQVHEVHRVRQVHSASRLHLVSPDGQIIHQERPTP
jgi:hypothetical protein